MPPVKHQSIGRRTRETSGIRNLQEKAKHRRRQHLESFMQGLPINQPGPFNTEVNVVTPTQGVQRVQGIGGLGSVSGLLQPSCIWSGTLIWISKSDSPTVDYMKFPCDVFRYVSPKSNDIETELKVETWPDKLLMRLLPKQVLIAAGGGLKGSKSVMFFIQQSVMLDYLRQSIRGDYVALVKFATRPSSPKCDIKALILWYMPSRKAYVGLIPKNQDTFMARLLEAFRQHQNKSNQPALAGGVTQSDMAAAGPRLMLRLLQQRAQRMMTGGGTGEQSSRQMTQTHHRREEQTDDDDDDDEDDDDEDDDDDDYDSDSE